MSEKDGGAAFPYLKEWATTCRADGSVVETYEDAPGQMSGMSLRDYFAAQALIALGDHKAVEARGIPWLASHAYMLADAMLAERSKP